MDYKFNTWFIAVPLLIAAGLVAMSAWRYAAHHHTFEQPEIGLPKVPLVFSTDARAGQAAYDRHCASCHGRYASGTSKGPSLLPYEEGHHGDNTFFAAVREGVKQHHWSFGDMPPLTSVKDVEISQIIRFVRELQQANTEPEPVE